MSTNEEEEKPPEEESYKETLPKSDDYNDDEIQLSIEAADENEAKTLHSGASTQPSTSSTRGKNKMATTSKLSLKQKGKQDYKRSYYSSVAFTPGSSKDLLVKDVSPSLSYSSAVTSNYIEDMSKKWIDLERGVTTMETSVNDYQENMERSLTLWAPVETSPTQIVEALQSQLRAPIDQLVVGIEKDSRVKSISKINIVCANEIACDQLKTNGIIVNNKRYYPKPSRPRPPPSRRAYLPNFPVAASEGDLCEAATNQGINILKIEPRLYKNTTIKIGGWTLWADLDSTMPDVIYFDNQEFATIWRGKGRKSNQTVESTNTIAAKPDKTTQRTAQPDETTKSTAKPAETNNNNDDEEMEIVLSKNQKRKMKRNLKKPQNDQDKKRPPKNIQQRNQDTANQSTTIPETFTTLESISRLEQGDKEVLFYNFPKDTSQDSIKNFLKNRNIEKDSINFYREQKNERRAALVKFKSFNEAIRQLGLCEERGYKYADRGIYARHRLGDMDEDSLRIFYRNL